MSKRTQKYINSIKTLSHEEFKTFESKQYMYSGTTVDKDIIKVHSSRGDGYYYSFIEKDDKYYGSTTCVNIKDNSEFIKCLRRYIQTYS